MLEQPPVASHRSIEPCFEDRKKLVELYNLGHYSKMETLAHSIIRDFPEQGIGWKALGTALYLQKRSADALAPLRQAAELLPDDADVYINLGNTLRDLGYSKKSEASYLRAIEINPDIAMAHSNLATSLIDQGRHKEGEVCYRRALEIQPDFIEVHKNLSIMLRNQGRYEEAEAYCLRALEINPDSAEAHNNLGITLRGQGKFVEAEACYRRALEINPDYVHVYSNLGITLKDQGRFVEAEVSCRRALEIDSNCAEARNNLSIILWCQGRFVEAEACCRRALEIDSNCAEAHNNLSIILWCQGQFVEAEACCRRALEIKPDYAEVHSNLAAFLNYLGRLEEAEAYCRRALEIKPDFIDAYSNMLFCRNYSVSYQISESFEDACKYGQMVARKALTRFTSWQCRLEPRCLRVGLVSGDLGNHPVGFFLEALLAHIDTSRVELIAYPTSNIADELTSRIKPYFSAWKPLLGQSDRTAAHLIHFDGIHVLIDLSGHTAFNRLPLFAWKPAPVQATWLGYLATTGVAEIDYLIGDPQATPPESDANFSESVWRLPEVWGCFSPPIAPLEIGLLPALSAGCVTFGCFNNLTKMNDAVVALWARVLLAVPGSRLFLKNKQLNDPTICETTRQRFSSKGIESTRLVLEGASPRVELLASYNSVDIALDPFPYGGGTTTFEALWMAVPIITRKGNSFLSRCGQSLACNAGLSNWIAEDDDDYVAKAVSHTKDLKQLATLRAGLRNQVIASPLFDVHRFARNFEDALWGMWQKWLDTKPDVDGVTKIGCNPQGQFDEQSMPPLIVGSRDLMPSSEHINKLIELYNLGAYEEMESIARCITVDFSGYGIGWKALGAALVGQKRSSDALIPLQRALDLLPNDVEIHNYIGLSFSNLGRPEEAVTSYLCTLEIKPDYVPALNNLGEVLNSQGKFVEAEAYCRRALEINPNYAEAYCNLGNILKDQCRYAEAEACYRSALRIKPNYALAQNNLIVTIHYNPTVKRDEIFNALVEWGERLAASVTHLPKHNNDHDLHRPLCIGLTSGSFHCHPVGFMTLAALERLPRESFRLLLYHDRSGGDHMTERFRARADLWQETLGFSDQALAELIQADRVDILIDLSGQMKGCRLGVVARRAAPVQIKWVGGLLNTTGLKDMDYLISDNCETPPGDDQWYTESLIRMPHGYVTYEPPEYAPQVSNLPVLNNGFVTFGCFNNATKINSELARLWGRIMVAVPESRLLLKYKQLGDAGARERFGKLLSDAGVPIDRVEMRGHSHHADLLATYNEVDIALDTWPYSGGLTTCEALWMGVPVVTLPGLTFAGRHSCSHLHNVGLKEWIAESADEYMEIAVRWASDIPTLSFLRANLRRQVKDSPLCDHAGFATDLGRALRQTWIGWCKKHQTSRSQNNNQTV